MPLKSMTAFGSGIHDTEYFQYRCEVKSLNARFIDINVRCPRSLNPLESLIISEVKNTLKRGKVDISFDLTPLNPTAKLPQLNEAAISHFSALGDRVQELSQGYPGELSVYELLKMDGVLQSPTQDARDEGMTLHKNEVLSTLRAALDQLITHREGEGAALKQALIGFVNDIKINREAVTKHSNRIRDHLFDTYKKKLETFLQRLGEQAPKALPEDRILGEIAIMADKCDIEEELVRLAAHEGEFLSTLDGDLDVGRKLDFLCQEMHREVNTISNKVMQMDIAKHTLNMKQAVERLRQQVQNIE